MSEMAMLQQCCQLCIQPCMTIFDEKYRVVAVESHSLTIRGVISGNVLVINTGLECPLAEEDFPVGRLIALNDPSQATPDQ